MSKVESKIQNVVHGGRVYEAARRWSIDPHDIIDFSANINPYGPPAGVIKALGDIGRCIKSYPDLSVLLHSISEKISVDPRCITIGNGSTALIFAATRAFRPRKALLLEPSFAEYRRALHSVNAVIESLRLLPETNFTPGWDLLNSSIESGSYDVVIINNPHNPSGNLIPTDELYTFANKAKSRNAALIIDEAFIDYVPESSTLPHILDLGNVVVLRSLTKFYSIPGLRIGYAVSQPDCALRMQQQIETWPVSNPAIDAALTALGDNDFDRLNRRQNILNRQEFAAALSELPDIQVFPSSANYLLVRFKGRNCAQLAAWLEQHHILIRLCDSFAGLGAEYARLAVLTPEHNLRLVALTKTWLAESKTL